MKSKKQIRKFLQVCNHLLCSIFHINSLLYSILLAEGECFEIDTNYDGSDIDTIDGINHVIVDSAKDCQLSCQALTNCKVWSYGSGGPGQNKCWRKSLNPGKSSTSDRISGQQFCGPRYFGFVGITLDNNEKVLHIDNVK